MSMTTRDHDETNTDVEQTEAERLRDLEDPIITCRADLINEDHGDERMKVFWVNENEFDALFHMCGRSGSPDSAGVTFDKDVRVMMEAIYHQTADSNVISKIRTTEEDEFEVTATMTEEQHKSWLQLRELYLPQIKASIRKLREDLAYEFAEADKVWRCWQENRPEHLRGGNLDTLSRSDVLTIWTFMQTATLKK